MTDLVSQLVAQLEDMRGKVIELCQTYGNALPHGSLERTDAAITAAKAGGWLPIETAPKDGTVVLLCRGERVTAGHWEPERWPTEAEYHSSTGEYLGSFETGECIDAWWYSADGGFSEDEHPTHWHPLPTPPKEQA